MKTSILNGMVYRNGAFEEGPVLMEDGLFAPPSAAPADRTLDARRFFLLPGLIDIHTHGCAGVDVNAAGRQGYETMSRFYASRGTAGFLCSILSDTVEQTEWCIRQAVDAIERPLPGARLLGIHLEGPFLSPRYKGAMPESALRNGDTGLFRRYQELARGHILYITVAPELPGALDLIRAVSDQTAVAIGHSDATYEEARAAIRAGARACTHVFNAMRPFDHHEPGIAGAVLESRDTYVEAITDGLHLHPGTLRMLLSVKGTDRVAAVTDSIMAAGMPDGQYRLGMNDVTVVNGDARLADGSARAGSTLTQERSLKNLLRFTGWPLSRVVPLLTETPADLLRLAGRGRIAPGSPADLTAADGDGNILAVIAAGRVVYAAEASGWTEDAPDDQ